MLFSEKDKTTQAKMYQLVSNRFLGVLCVTCKNGINQEIK